MLTNATFVKTVKQHKNIRDNVAPKPSKTMYNGKQWKRTDAKHNNSESSLSIY